jgi:hypothetical protein
MEAACHGAASGFPGFTYYADTLEFAKLHQAKIAEVLEQLASDLGENAIELVQNFGCFHDNKPTTKCVALAMYSECHATLTKDELDQVELVQNALAWFALEEVGNAIVEHYDFPSKQP